MRPDIKYCKYESVLEISLLTKCQIKCSPSDLWHILQEFKNLVFNLKKSFRKLCWELLVWFVWLQFPSASAPHPQKERCFAVTNWVFKFISQNPDSSHGWVSGPLPSVDSQSWTNKINWPGQTFLAPVQSCTKTKTQEYGVNFVQLGSECTKMADSFD